MCGCGGMKALEPLLDDKEFDVEECDDDCEPPDRDETKLTIESCFKCW